MGLAEFFIKLGTYKRLLKWCFFIAVFLSLFIDFLIPRPHAEHHGGINTVLEYPCFWGILAFVGAVLFIRICKAAAHTFLGKNEDYYD